MRDALSVFHISYAVSDDFSFCQNAFSSFQLEFKQNGFRQHPKNIGKDDISGLFPSLLKEVYAAVITNCCAKKRQMIRMFMTVFQRES